jgi:mycothiol synthase
MDLPSDYRVRAPTAEDLDAVAEVLIASDLDAAGQRVLDAGFVQDQWSRVGFDLASDAWVVVHRGEAIVAYGQAMREEPTVVESWGCPSRAPGAGHRFVVVGPDPAAGL